MNIQKSQLCNGVNKRGLKGFDPYPYCQIYCVNTFFQLGMKQKQVLVGGIPTPLKNIKVSWDD